MTTKTGTSAGETLVGGDTNDTLVAYAGDDTLDGGAGDDTLVGGIGNDSYVFRSDFGRDDIVDNGGDEKLLFKDATGLEEFSISIEKDLENLDVIIITTADGRVDIGETSYEDGRYSIHFGESDELLGKLTIGDSDNLLGDAGKDWLVGLDGDNVLEGGDGDDILAGGAGADRLDGGDGTDTAYYYSSAGVRVSLLLQGQGQSQIDFGGTHGFTANNNEAVGDILSNVENLMGSNYADWLTGDGGDNVLRGRSGNDRLEGGAGADTYVFASGDDRDTVVDDGGKIVFAQGTDNDYAGATYSFVRADAGGSVTVTLTVRDSNGNTLNAIEFTTYSSSGYRFYTRDSNGVDSEIDASLLLVPMRVGTEENPFLATEAADTFTGSDGADWVRYAELPWRYDGVTIDLSTDPATASGGFAAGDRLTGINNIIGSRGHDTLRGNSGDNILRGGAGNDYLEGGAGADILNGGAHLLYGSDTASYSSSRQGVRVDLSKIGAQQDFDVMHGFTANNNEAVGDTLSGIEDIEGSDHDDWLTGDGGNNYLSGSGGDDRLEGGDGNDYLEGGDGNDRLEGGAGDDNLYGQDGNDHLEGGAGDDRLYSGIDSRGNGDDRLYGGAGDDVLFGGAGADTLDGGDGTDFVSYSYTSLGGVRVDLSRLGAQIDFDEKYDFTANNNVAVGDILTNIENIGGTRGDDWFTGDGGNNYLSGSGGDDRLEGGAGDDRLDGGSGDDHLDGGAGADTYTFSVGEGTDTINDEAGDTLTLRFEGFASDSYTAADFTEASNNFNRVGNNLEINIGGNKITILNAYDTDSTTGTGAAAFTINIKYGILDRYTFTEVTNTEVTNDFWHNLFAKGSEENLFVATDVADTFAGTDGEDWGWVSYAESTSGVDVDLSTDPATVSGGFAAGDRLSGINNLIGSDAGDTLRGNSDANVLRGGDGIDYLYGNAGADTLEGGDGDDYLYGNEGTDTLEGGAGNDRLWGGAGADTLEGGDGYDWLYGGEGADTLDGGDGQDVAFYVFSSQGVRVDLSKTGAQIDFDGRHDFTANNNEAVGDRLTGIEHIGGSFHDDWLTGDGNDNELLGYAGDDRLDGAAGDDILYGHYGNDRLDGGAGNDSLDGDSGDDQLYGGAGNDGLSGDAGDDHLYGGAGDDRLRGGGGDDRLEGGAGADTYGFSLGDGTDTIDDEAGDTMTLRFGEYYGGYTSSDFVEASNNFDRVGNNLEITIGGNEITILNAYDSDPNTGIGNAAFTINIEYRVGEVLTEVTNDFWHHLFAKGNEERPLLATDAADTFADTDGEDWDWVSYEGSTSGVYVDLSTDPATVSGGWAAGDTLIGINNLIGSSGSDIFFGNGGANTLEGGAGSDQLYGYEGADSLEGGAGSDQLFGNDGADQLYGGAGSDRLYGGEGADIIDGGDGVGDLAGYYYSSQGVRVDLSKTGAQEDFNGMHGFTANNNEAVGDTLIGIEGITGSYYDDWLTGDDNANHLYGDAGDDRLEGGLGADTYTFDSGDGTDTIDDEAGDTMTLRFEDYSYVAADFVEGSNNFNRVGNDLEISIGRNEITILDAYDSDPSTGTGNAAFTISVEYGISNGDTLTEVTDAFWHNLLA